jgi:hypothetical protein
LLLGDDQMRESLSQKARERALSFTWDKTARRILQLFDNLHEKRKLVSPNRLLNVFAPTPPEAAHDLRGIGSTSQGRQKRKYKSIVLGMNEHYESCLIRDAAYPLRVEDGLVLSLLKNHTVREAEAVLAAVVEDEAEAKATLKRVCGLIHATA